MTEVADFIRSIATLLWPILGFFILWIFRPELQRILARLRAGKFLGQEIQLADSLDELNVSAQKAASETPHVINQPPAAEQAFPQYPPASGIVEHILSEASRDPKVALILLATEMEREVRHLLASMGNTGVAEGLTLRRSIDRLQKVGLLPVHLVQSVNSFWHLRNELVHGRHASRDDLIRAIDSGLVILRTIQAIPHEVNVVYHPGVEVYSLPDGRGIRPDIKAVVLETTSPGGAAKSLRAFPTTRTHFQKGKRVAWEWNRDLIVGESWYRHPDTDEITYGWTESMEFVGRSLEDV